jgi:hypothetical protein
VAYRGGKYWRREFFSEISGWGVQGQNKNFSFLAISELSKPTKPTGGKSALNTSIIIEILVT